MFRYLTDTRALLLIPTPNSCNYFPSRNINTCRRSYTRFLFYKQHFYKQRQAEIGKKIKQVLSNTLRLGFCYLKIIHSLHPRYHPKIIGHILKNKQKNKRVFIHEIIGLIIMKVKIKMKNRSHAYKINRSRKTWTRI